MVFYFSAKFQTTLNSTFYFHFFEIKTNSFFILYFPQMDSQTKVVSHAGKRMLSFALSSAVSHNRKNLAHSAKNKNPDKLTIAEKEALQAPKVSVWQECSDKSDKSWDAYLAKKAYKQRSIKLVEVWQQCSDNSDKSWADYVWNKDNVWKYCSSSKSWTSTADSA